RRIAAGEAVRPIRGAGGEHRAATGVHAHAGGAGATLLPLLIPLGIVGMPARLAGAEHFKGLWAAVASGRGGQPLAPFQFTAVALVADNAVLAAKGIAALQPGALEQPVVGPVHGVGGRAVHELAMAAVVAAPEETDPGHLRLRATEQ